MLQLTSKETIEGNRLVFFLFLQTEGAEPVISRVPPSSPALEVSPKSLSRTRREFSSLAKSTLTGPLVSYPGGSCEWIYFQKSRKRGVEGQEEVRKEGSPHVFNHSANMIGLPVPIAHWTKLCAGGSPPTAHTRWFGTVWVGSISTPAPDMSMS